MKIKKKISDLGWYFKLQTPEREISLAELKISLSKAKLNTIKNYISFQTRTAAALTMLKRIEEMREKNKDEYEKRLKKFEEDYGDGAKPS